MPISSPRPLLPVIVLPLSIVLARLVGGWATITVDDLPDHVVVGRPFVLDLTVRQHGVRPLSGLRPVLEAVTPGMPTVRIDASPLAADGRYQGSLTLPREGEWRITIHGGFGSSRVTLLPLRAIAPGAAVPAPLGAAERGRRLFLAKGCVGCHVIGEFREQNIVSVGPELTDRRFPAASLARFLADPTTGPQRGASRMPDLGLRAGEIAALVAYINGDRQVTGR